MARRGAVLLDLKTPDDLAERLKADCLLVLNVYDEFFGPCAVNAPNLRDFKVLEGGDNLEVYTIKANIIDELKRFRHKSEPAYLVLANGRVVNSYMGCNVAELLDLLRKELELFKSGESLNRLTYELRERSAIEAERFRIMREELIKHRLLDQEKKSQMVYDYNMKLTSDIMDNAADTGVVLFMPHVINDDLLNNMEGPANAMKLQLKTYETIKITKEDFEMINFDEKNMSMKLFRQIQGRDLLICAYKMQFGELTPINEVFSEFARSLRNELNFEVEAREKKAAKQALKAKKGRSKSPKVEPKVEEEDDEENVSQFKMDALAIPSENLVRETPNPISIEPIDLQFIEYDQDIIKLMSQSIIDFTVNRVVEMHNECIKGELINLFVQTKRDVEGRRKTEKLSKKKREALEQKNKPRDFLVDLNNPSVSYLPPVWTPPTPRSHAMILFLYFRRLLSYFLPMDPPGAGRYVIIAFGAERCDEILNYLKDHPNYTKSILAYGIFRGFVDGENFADSQLICKTAVEYRMGTAEPGDKLIFKVVSDSESLLALVLLDPVLYVSQHYVDARAECDVLFPLGYTTKSEEEAEAEIALAATLEDEVIEEEDEESTKSSRKKKKKRKGKDNESVDGTEGASESKENA